ncbi:VPS13A_C [Mytilus edulis]|uniref:VPS13A_C n=1 Tax=Mytilus edulis TaxID=6550 RepID=A0A8S3S890_MYTED|nr:VPS13A_C [Mytilus edulis]
MQSSSFHSLCNAVCKFMFCASLKIANSEWSDKFSLDTVGSSGNVQCRDNKKQIFTVGVKITLSSSGLTKICTFTPFYMLLNTTEAMFSFQNKLLCLETGKDKYKWIEVDSKECMPFWPLQSGNDLTMMARVSKPVKKSSSFQVYTDKWSMQSGSYLPMLANVLDTFEETSAFLFDKEHTTLMKLKHNKHTGLNVNCKVTESATVITFSEYMDGMATALLINHTNKDSLRFRQSGNLTKYELASQRYMLYTWDNAIGKREIIWTLGEKQDEINDLQQDGIGELTDKCGSKIYWVSFLNGIQRVLLFTDVATVAREIGQLENTEEEITFSIQRIGLSVTNDAKQKEVAYIEIASSGIIWEEKQKKRYITLDTKTGETLEEGYQEFIAKQESGEGPSSKVLLANKIEVDNQMSDATFQTVFTPTPLVKSIAAENIPKPFIELSLTIRKPKHSTILQFKYCKVLTQEMTLKIDLRFLSELIEIFYSPKSFSSEQQIHLSISSQDCGGDGIQTVIDSDIASILLQSAGVVLGNAQDVILNKYVLVLGLDVLGNPFGLIRGMAEGIEDLFNEPYQGAVLGQEFAEGLAIGVKSLFGHTVGGVSGAFSKMTGVLGKGLAALTFDDDYQKKRREDIINKQSANAKESLARGGKAS